MVGEYTFPSVRGVQAGREYYVSMCPLRLIPKLFIFDEEELGPDIRAQRILSKGRIPAMARYMIENPKGYVFSAITASIDGEVKFEPLGTDKDADRIGMLRIPMSARFIINDGQHRRAAIERALLENPALGDENIAVVFFLDIGLERCQQMFADLNRYAVRPARSLGILYDYRDERASLARTITFRSTAFCDLVDLERSTVSLRSKWLFALSAIYTATSALLNGRDEENRQEDVNTAVSFWDKVGDQFPEWQLVREHKMTASAVRENFIHSYGIVLHAIGNVGNELLGNSRVSWKARVKLLKGINWSKSNGKLWEGRALVGGKVSKAGRHVILTTNAIKKHLKLKLSPAEKEAEKAFSRGTRG